MTISQSTSHPTVMLQGADDKAPASKNTSSYPDKIWNYAKSRFDKDNWFGSVVLINSWVTGYNKLMGSLTREVHGEKAPDRARAVSSAVPLLGFTWSFVSKRGAKFPEGDTIPQRMMDALHHPHESSNQFEFLVFLPTNLLAIYNNIDKGLKAHGVGLRQGERAYTPEKVRLYQGALSAAWQLCIGYGHFRKRDEDLTKDAEKPSRPGVLGIVQEVWRHDRVLAVGSILNVAMPFLSVAEGWNKIRTSRQEAVYILRGAALGVAAAVAYNYYIFQRITKSNFDKKEDKQNISPSTENPPKEADHNDNRNHAGFTQKILAQRQLMQALPDLSP